MARVSLSLWVSRAPGAASRSGSIRSAVSLAPVSCAPLDVVAVQIWGGGPPRLLVLRSWRPPSLAAALLTPAAATAARPPRVASKEQKRPPEKEREQVMRQARASRPLARCLAPTALLFEVAHRGGIAIRAPAVQLEARTRVRAVAPPCAAAGVGAAEGGGEADEEEGCGEAGHRLRG